MAVDGVDDAVRAVSQFLVADAPLGVTLRRIADLATASIGDAVACGLTMLDPDGVPTTAVFTDELSPAVDQGQYADQAGPCLDAFRTATTVRVADLEEIAHRWPSFHDIAKSNGVTSTLSIPLSVPDDCLGAMNLYATTGRAFTIDDEADAALFATQAAVVMANARAYWRTFDLAEGLQAAMGSRAEIEQAKGKIMAIKSCDADAAFAVLVRASQHENLKLRDIAHRVVATVSGLGIPLP